MKHLDSKFTITIILFLLISSFLAYKNSIANEKIRNLNSKINSINLENQKIKETMKNINSPDTAVLNSSARSYTFDNLKNLGIKDPVDFIKSDLVRKNDLIPFKGTLGGNMQFNSKENIFVLTNKLVLAYFDDGHTQGNMVLKFHIKDDKTIQWEAITAEID